jgi:hypothetical protein
MPATSADIDELFAQLNDDDCTYCDGALTRGTYKDTPAVLCEDCGTPAVRSW